VADDLLAQDRREGSDSRCRRDGLDDAGQVGAVPASLLEQDQGAEPGGDEVLDAGDLVAGGLVSLNRSAFLRSGY
jgi:hypothetical protein